MARPHGFITRGAEENLFEWCRARVVNEQGWWLSVGGPAVAPTHQGHESGREVHALCGQAVFESWWAVLVLDLVQDSMVDKPAQPIGEQVACNTKVVVQLAETMDASEDVAQDQQCPSITDKIQGGLDRARRQIAWIRWRPSEFHGVVRVNGHSELQL